MKKIICKKCLKEKSLLEFSFKNKKKNIRHCVCKICQRVYKLTYYYKNKDSHYKRNLKNKQKLQEYIKSVKKECFICKENEKVCLSFHHLRDKEIEVSKLVLYGSLTRIKNEIAKCIVLCENCHRKVHAGVLKLNISVV